MFKYMHKMLRKIKRRNLKLTLAGETITLFALGSIFSHQLLQYNLYIFIVGVLVAVNYTTKNWVAYHARKRLELGSHYWGYLGTALLLVALGVQITPLPFKFWILGLGILLTLPALRDLMK